MPSKKLLKMLALSLLDDDDSMAVLTTISAVNNEGDAKKRIPEAAVRSLASIIKQRKVNHRITNYMEVVGLYNPEDSGQCLG